MAQKIKSNQELIELGKTLQTFIDTGYVSKKQALLFGFFKGMVTGAGAFIGGTVVISLVLWMLSLFGTIPFLGDIIDKVSNNLQH